MNDGASIESGTASAFERAGDALVRRMQRVVGSPAEPGFTNSAVGGSRLEPAPSDQPITAGPWTVAINEIVKGPAASELVANANWANAPIRDGMQFIAVRLTVTNNGSRACTIQNGDFGVTGDRNLLYRFVDVQPPDPVLHGVVEQGASLEGWIVSAATSDEENLCLVYDSLTLGGNWADVVIALDAGATIADASARLREPNTAGDRITAPAAVGETIATADWVITINQVIEGQDVYNLFPGDDYRTTALGDTYAAGLPYWVGLNVTISNNRTGGACGFFPSTAFIAVDGNDSTFDEAMVLTPPNPTVVGGYYPGGTREGWILIAMPVGYGLELVRFRPSDLSGETRYFTLTGSVGSVPPEAKSFAVGDIVEIIEDQVNLREAASTDSGIVVVLELGDRLVITGEGQEADGYTWYPVEREAGDQAGFVASHLLELVN